MSKLRIIASRIQNNGTDPYPREIRVDTDFGCNVIFCMMAVGQSGPSVRVRILADRSELDQPNYALQGAYSVLTGDGSGGLEGEQYSNYSLVNITPDVATATLPGGPTYVLDLPSLAEDDESYYTLSGYWQGAAAEVVRFYNP